MQEMTLHLNDFCSNVINNARTPFLETKKPLHLNGISTTYSAKIQEWKPKGKAKDESLNETENCLSIYSLLYNKVLKLAKRSQGGRTPSSFQGRVFGT